MNRWRLSVWWLALMTGWMACDSGGGSSGSEEVTLVGEFCEHAEEGPFEDVVAAADRASGPDATAEHAAVRVDLSGLLAGERGYVKWIASADSEFAFGLSGDVPLEVLDVTGTAVPGHGSTAIPAADCEVMALYHSLDLRVGTHFLAFGPTAATTVTMVVEDLAEF